MENQNVSENVQVLEHKEILKGVQRLKKEKKNSKKKVKTKYTWKEVKKNWQIYFLLFPTLIYVFVYSYIPMYGIQIAFRDYSPRKGILGSPWVGLEYFIKFFESYRFEQLLSNTLLLSLMTLLISFPIPIILAIMLNQVKSKRFKSFVQTILYTPNFITVVVLVGMMSVFLSPHTGIVNIIIQKLGGDPVHFMGEAVWFRWLYVLSGVWQGAGFSAIIYIGALASVPTELYEAAKIDGASRLQTIINVDLPCIKPMIITMLILAVGGLMNVGFEKVLIMQNDLNRGVSDVIATYVYDIGVTQAQYSLSTAIGLFNTVINAILLIFANSVSKKVSEEGIW